MVYKLENRNNIKEKCLHQLTQDLKDDIFIVSFTTRNHNSVLTILQIQIYVFELLK